MPPLESVLVELGKFSLPATAQSANLEQSAYTQQANNDAIELYINVAIDAVKQDMQALFDKVNQEHP